MRHFHASGRSWCPCVRPGTPEPLDLFTVGMTARRAIRSTLAAPHSSAVPALSIADEPMPITPTRLPLSVA